MPERGAGAGAGDRHMSRKFMLAACTAAVAVSHVVAFHPCSASALWAQRHVALRPSTSQACAAGGRIRAPVPRAERRSAAARYPGCARRRERRRGEHERPGEFPLLHPDRHRVMCHGSLSMAEDFKSMVEAAAPDATIVMQKGTYVISGILRIEKARCRSIL